MECNAIGIDHKFGLPTIYSNLQVRKADLRLELLTLGVKLMQNKYV